MTGPDGARTDGPSLVDAKEKTLSDWPLACCDVKNDGEMMNKFWGAVTNVVIRGTLDHPTS